MKTSSFNLLTCLLAGTIVGAAASTPALADQRALLVGVGKYATPGNDLPGIDIDIDRMRDTLYLMGFEDAQIRSLLDEQSTAKNVIAEIRTWLTEGVQASDRVVFYYSGHGSYVPDFDGDEKDGVDEVLVTHDARRVLVNGRATLDNVLLDDVLNELLSKIPSRNVLTIVDACHSGTTTRSFKLVDKSLTTEAAFAKTFVYEGMPEGDDGLLSRGIEVAATDPEDDSNFVSISAADDNEKAIGTSAGGVFTIGLTKAIESASKKSENVSLLQLQDRASSYIRTTLSGDRIHHPQVTGNRDLARGAFQIVPLTRSVAPNRKKLQAMVEEANAELVLWSSSLTYAVGDPVELLVEIPPGGGYLNVVTVDAEDTATVLFPNRVHPDNAVAAGKLRIPSDTMPFTLPAAEPLGPTLVAAFFTRDAINFHEQTLEGRDSDGNIMVAFTSLSPVATRAIKIAPRREEMYAAQLELNVVDKR